MVHALQRSHSTLLLHLTLIFLFPHSPLWRPSFKSRQSRQYILRLRFALSAKLRGTGENLPNLIKNSIPSVRTRTHLMYPLHPLLIKFGQPSKH